MTLPVESLVYIKHYFLVPSDLLKAPAILSDKLSEDLQLVEKP